MKHRLSISLFVLEALLDVFGLTTPEKNRERIGSAAEGYAVQREEDGFAGDAFPMYPRVLKIWNFGTAPLGSYPSGPMKWQPNRQADFLGIVTAPKQVRLLFKRTAVGGWQAMPS